MRSKGISPLLAAIILVALTISLAFIMSATISSMFQRTASATSKTATASGGALKVHLDSISCNATTGDFQMVLELTGVNSATGISVVVKDAKGILHQANDTSITLSSGLNIVTLNFGAGNLAVGDLQYLAVSTMDPTIMIEYNKNDFGFVGTCEK